MFRSKAIQRGELFISDLLSRLQMWTISAEIINIANLPALTELNQVSTLFICMRLHAVRVTSDIFN